MNDYSYYPDLTMDCLTDYAKKSISEKGCKEGANLHRANHVRNVQFNNISDCIKYGFIRGEVVPQTRVNEKPYKVWVCLNLETCQILTGECGCIAGYSESCKHVFALLHFIVHHVSLGHNKTCTSKRQVWHETVRKGEKIHPPVRMKAVSFNRPHPEYEHGYTKPKRATFDPRPLQDREVIIDWNKVFTATEGCASVLCFKSTLSSDHQYINNSSTSKIKPLTLQFIVTDSQNFNEFESLAKENRTSDHISEIELLTKGQSSNDLWFDYRKGVITASVSHNVLTKFKKLHPSVISIENLVAKILGYPKKVKTASLSWGIEHETYARKRYIKQNRRMHKNFSCNESGLILHSENFMSGASVDGVVTCACCGIGNLEIKCPFSHRDKNIQQYIQQHVVYLR